MTRNLSSTIMAGLLLSSGTLLADVICGKEQKLKPVRCVCGKVIDQSGAPVPDATVNVTKGGGDAATTRTNGDGKFIFDEMKSGSYGLYVAAQEDIFKVFTAPIVVASPPRKCKWRLVIVLVTGYPDNCGSYVMKH